MFAASPLLQQSMQAMCGPAAPEIYVVQEKNSVGLLERLVGILSLPKLVSGWLPSPGVILPSSHKLASDILYVSSRPNVRLRSLSFGSVK